MSTLSLVRINTRKHDVVFLTLSRQMSYNHYSNSNSSNSNNMHHNDRCQQQVIEKHNQQPQKRRIVEQNQRKRHKFIVFSFNFANHTISYGACVYRPCDANSGTQKPTKLEPKKLWMTAETRYIKHPVILRLKEHYFRMLVNDLFTPTGGNGNGNAGGNVQGTQKRMINLILHSMIVQGCRSK